MLEQSLMADEETAEYLAGRQAHAEGLGLDANPYRDAYEQWDERLLWFRGWYRAQGEDRRKDFDPKRDAEDLEVCDCPLCTEVHEVTP